MIVACQTQAVLQNAVSTFTPISSLTCNNAINLKSCITLHIFDRIGKSNLSQNSLHFRISAKERLRNLRIFNTRELPNTTQLPSRNRNVNLKMEGGSKERNVIGDGDAVIIVDHGSRSQDANLMLNAFVAMFKEKTGYPVVEPAHMELARPSIEDAFRVCVQQGATRIILSPFFLSPGRHWKQDIPKLASEAASDHPGTSYLVTAPLGLHELLVDVMNDRIKYCLSHVAGDADECAVCHGTGKCREFIV